MTRNKHIFYFGLEVIKSLEKKFPSTPSCLARWLKMLISGILSNDEKCQNIDFLVSIFHTFAWRLNEKWNINNWYIYYTSHILKNLFWEIKHFFLKLRKKFVKFEKFHATLHYKTLSTGSYENHAMDDKSMFSDLLQNLRRSLLSSQKWVFDIFFSFLELCIIENLSVIYLNSTIDEVPVLYVMTELQSTSRWTRTTCDVNCRTFCKS